MTDTPPIMIDVRLPLRPEHAPADGKLPDATGRPVLLGQPTTPQVRAGLLPDDTPRIGRVVRWEDLGNGYALATLELNVRELDLPKGFQFGVNAICKRGADGQVDSIDRIQSISLIGPDTKTGESK